MKYTRIIAGFGLSAALFVSALVPGIASASYSHNYQTNYNTTGYGMTQTSYWCGSYWSADPCYGVGYSYGSPYGNNSYNNMNYYQPYSYNYPMYYYSNYAYPNSNGQALYYQVSPYSYTYSTPYYTASNYQYQNSQNYNYSYSYGGNCPSGYYSMNNSCYHY